MKIHQLPYTLETLDEVADDIYSLLPDVKVITFAGSLGAGKTTLIQALLRKGGISQTIQSPTFTYLHKYVNTLGQQFYHFDLYRLTSKQDFIEAGFEEYLYEMNSWALIEWPEIIRSFLKSKVCSISIEYVGENSRRLLYTIKE